MPSPQTFTMLPISQLLARYIRPGGRVLDPFAGNSLVGTRTNDLNPLTRAQDHLEADEFLDKVLGEGVLYHVTLLDPPYSPRQVQECYQGFGRRVAQRDTQQAVLTAVRDRAARLLTPDGVVISFGWSTEGMGIGRGFKIVQLMLVAHGAHHNDTIVIVEARDHSSTESRKSRRRAVQNTARKSRD